MPSVRYGSALVQPGVLELRAGLAHCRAARSERLEQVHRTLAPVTEGPILLRPHDPDRVIAAPSIEQRREVLRRPRLLPFLVVDPVHQARIAAVWEPQTGEPLGEMAHGCRAQLVGAEPDDVAGSALLTDVGRE